MTTKAKTAHLPWVAGVYIITNTTDGKVYIGQGQSQEKNRAGIRGRILHHLDNLHSGQSNRHLQHAWNKFGEDAFTFEVLLECPEEQCDYWEDYYIGVFQSWRREWGYNFDRYSRGNGPRSEETIAKLRGKKHSAETKEKMRAAKLGKKRPPEVGLAVSRAQKGKVISDETRAKHAEASRGRKHTDAIKEKIGKAATGRKHTEATLEKLRSLSHSPETRQKIGDAGRGRVTSDETKIKLQAIFSQRVWVIAPTGVRRRVSGVEADTLVLAGWRRGKV